MKTIELSDNPVLEDVEKAIDGLRAWALFEYTNSDNMPAIAEQHFLLGISSLETAMRHMTLARIDMSQIIAKHGHTHG